MPETDERLIYRSEYPCGDRNRTLEVEAHSQGLEVNAAFDIPWGFILRARAVLDSASTSTAFTYTLQDLESLRECMRCNDGFSAALRAFSSLREWTGGFPWIPYLEFAEKIKLDPDWPEKHFAAAQKAA